MKVDHKAGDGAGASIVHAGQDDERLLRLPSCLQMVQIGRTAWLDMVKAGQAPQAVKIGRATFWVASEVQAFIAERIRRSRKG
jgi:predicted DNA-binding transcriptional regulator AlpA